MCVSMIFFSCLLLLLTMLSLAFMCCVSSTCLCASAGPLINEKVWLHASSMGEKKHDNSFYVHVTRGGLRKVKTDKNGKRSG